MAAAPRGPCPVAPAQGEVSAAPWDHLSQTLSLDKHLWLLLISSSVSTAMMRTSPHCPRPWPLLHRAEARAGSVLFLASPGVRHGHGEGRAGENWSPHLMTCLRWGRWASQQAGHGGECWEPSPRPGRERPRAPPWTLRGAGWGPCCWSGFGRVGCLFVLDSGSSAVTRVAECACLCISDGQKRTRQNQPRLPFLAGWIFQHKRLGCGNT